MATNIARGHGGDGGGRPPRRTNRIPTACESSKPRTRGHGNFLNLYEKFEDNNSRPLPLEFDDTGKQFKFIGDNYQMFVRLVSNEVAIIVPFHYRSWDDVPAKYKRLIFPMLQVSIRFLLKSLCIMDLCNLTTYCQVHIQTKRYKGSINVNKSKICYKNKGQIVENSNILCPIIALYF